MMGFRFVTDEWVADMERDLNCYKMRSETLEAENRRMQKQYRELRDSKDEEIARLHAVIEDSKQQTAKALKEVDEALKVIKRLRQAVVYYERLKTLEARDDKAAV